LGAKSNGGLGWGKKKNMSAIGDIKTHRGAKKNSNDKRCGPFAPPPKKRPPTSQQFDITTGGAKGGGIKVRQN